MPRPNLRRTARSQARAEYQPQIRGVRREAASQARSIRSMAPALEGSLSRTAEQLRHANLSPRDLAIAERELAYRTADVGASTALQVGQVNRDAASQIVDLRQAEAQSARATLTGLQTAAAEHARDVADEEAAEARAFSNDILKAQAEKALGLGTYYDEGLTPTQRREQSADHAGAAFYAKQYFQAAKKGLKVGSDGKALAPDDADYESTPWTVTPSPHHWGDDTWSSLVAKVQKTAGVDVPVAERAVQAIRDHVDGPMAPIARAAGAALAPVLQFGNALVQRR